MEPDRFDEHVRTHYRLTKMNGRVVAFDEARRYLEIDEAVHPADAPPLAGWDALWFAHLRDRTFDE